MAENTAVESGRILALDLGNRRIGLALSDELLLTAQPLDTLVRKNIRADLAALRRIIEARGVTQLLLGDPRHLSGDMSERSAIAREFAARLEKEFGLPVRFRDERFTSVQAERILAERGVRRRDDPGAVDRVAAVVLLQDYLDAERFRRQGANGL